VIGQFLAARCIGMTSHRRSSERWDPDGSSATGQNLQHLAACVGVQCLVGCCVLGCLDVAGFAVVDAELRCTLWVPVDDEVVAAVDLACRPPFSSARRSTVSRSVDGSKTSVTSKLSRKASSAPPVVVSGAAIVCVISGCLSERAPVMAGEELLCGSAGLGHGAG
jgi:hypothetical protein